MEENLIKRLIATIKCGNCGQNYKEDCVDIIEHIEELWFLNVSCSYCGVKSLVTVIFRKDEKPDVITDLNEAERERFRDADAVGGDDVLDMHRFLKDFDGDFPRLFRQ